MAKAHDTIPRAYRKKWCSSCRKVKCLDDFYGTNGRSVSGFCRRCVKAYTREWQARNPEQVRVYARTVALKKYGLSRADYDEMLLRQRNECAICGGGTGGGRRALAVDHDHETGAVRGLLCGRCNTALGSFGDSEEILLRAVKYLRRHRQD